jgi:hypothetical protein
MWQFPETDLVEWRCGTVAPTQAFLGPKAERHHPTQQGQARSDNLVLAAACIRPPRKDVTADSGQFHCTTKTCRRRLPHDGVPTLATSHPLAHSRTTSSERKQLTAHTTQHQTCMDAPCMSEASMQTSASMLPSIPPETPAACLSLYRFEPPLAAYPRTSDSRVWCLAMLSAHGRGGGVS